MSFAFSCHLLSLDKEVGDGRRKKEVDRLLDDLYGVTCHPADQYKASACLENFETTSCWVLCAPHQRSIAWHLSHWKRSSMFFEHPSWLRVPRSISICQSACQADSALGWQISRIQRRAKTYHFFHLFVSFQASERQDHCLDNDRQKPEERRGLTTLSNNFLIEMAVLDTMIR